MVSLEIFHWQSFRPNYGPGVNSASNRNEYQEYFLRVKAAGAYGWQPYQLYMLIVLKSGSLNLLEPSGSANTIYNCRLLQNWMAYICNMVSCL